MEIPSNKELLKFINEYFGDEDLEIFCFNYFMEVRNDFTSGMRKSTKVMDLIQYCKSRDLMETLLFNLRQEREKPYQQTFSPQEPLKSPPLYAPKARNPKQVFISHASKDGALAQRIAATLQANGYPIFMTPNSIQPGEKWVPAINRGMEESGIFVVLLTPNAMASGWVQDETFGAIALENKNEMRVFMLDVEACQLPFMWQQRQFLSFRGDDVHQNIANLLQALDGKIVQYRPNPAPIARQTAVSERSFIDRKTSLEFVRIPAGEFLYGDDKDPKHLPEFWISKTPVTQIVYKRFIDANPGYDVPFRDDDWAKPYNWDKKKRTYPADKADHPVVLVSWYDALAFCQWAGLQLPTEEQWEKAARGNNGQKYPWGENEPTDKLCNFNKDVGGTTPVGQYSPQGDSPYGCVDMSGNVWEWCLNKYNKPQDTQIDKSGDWRVLRGGSWGLDANFVRAAFRYYNFPVSRNYYYGFRVGVVHPPSQ